MGTSLENIRVVEFTQVISGSIAGMLMGDLGAEVIKIEKPVEGDFYREQALKVNGISTMFPAYNRNKKSLAIDIRQPAAQEAIRDLIKTADIVIENFRPGIMAKNGLGYEDLKKVKPDIIMVSISGFGQSGPSSSKPAFDMTISAMSGLMSVNGTPGNPTKMGPAVVDFLSGIYGAIGAMSALRYRDINGVGQHVDVAMVDAAISILDAFMAQYRFTGIEPKANGNRRAGYAPVNAYPTADGAVFISASMNKHWQALARVMGREDLLAEEKYAVPEGRKQDEEYLENAVAQWAKQHTTAEIVTQLDAVSCPCAPVNSISGVMQDEQICYRKSILEFDYPGLGSYPVAAHVPKYSEMEVNTQRAPLLGEHNEEILGGILGLTPEQIAALTGV